MEDHSPHKSEVEEAEEEALEVGWLALLAVGLWTSLRASRVHVEPHFVRFVPQLSSLTFQGLAQVVVLIRSRLYRLFLSHPVGSFVSALSSPLCMPVFTDCHQRSNREKDGPHSLRSLLAAGVKAKAAVFLPDAGTVVDSLDPVLFLHRVSGLYLALEACHIRRSLLRNWRGGRSWRTFV